MSTPDLESFFSIALSVGMPAHAVDRLRRDPEQVRSLIAARQAQGSASHSSAAETPDDTAKAYKASIDAAQANFDAEQKRPQRFPPAADRLSTIAAAERARAEAVSMDASVKGQIMWNFMGVGKHSSSTPLEKLKPIRFKEMMVTKMHEGRFLLCRIVSSPAKMIGITFVVEDQNGRVDTVGIYNLSLRDISTGPDLDALFPRGTILAIREPTYKPNRSGTCYLVRIESPTDYEVLSSKHPLVKGAKWATSSPAAPRPASFDFKVLGNRYFAAKKDRLARLVLFLNRAQAHLRLGNFASSLRDTAAVLGFLASDVPGPLLAEFKATLRRARALEGLRQLNKARAAFEHVVELDPTSAEARAGVQRVERMLHESATGEYDWRQIVKDTEGDIKHELAVGDYVGPVKVIELEGRGGGRGVVATRDIKVGELLLVEKAFATGEATKDRIVMGFNLASNSATEASKMALITSCAAKIQDDPSAAAVLYALHGGNDFEPVGTAVLGAQQARDVAATAQEPACADIARIEEICIVNAFGLRQTAPDEVDQAKSGSALLLGGSLFNHSCAPNASWCIYGDVQVVRAREPVRAGDELCIAYVPAEAPQERRNGVLKAHFPAGGCTCLYCVDERRDTPQQVARRAELVAPGSKYVELRGEANTDRPVSPAWIAKLARDVGRIVEQLEATYARRREGAHGLRPALIEPYHTLAHVASQTSAPGAYRLGNAYDLKALSATGAEVRETPDGIEVVAAPILSLGERSVAERFLLKVAFRHAHLRSSSGDVEARKWIKAAAEMARVTHGMDWDGFVERAEKELNMWGLKRLLAGCRT